VTGDVTLSSIPDKDTLPYLLDTNSGVVSCSNYSSLNIPTSSSTRKYAGLTLTGGLNGTSGNFSSTLQVTGNVTLSSTLASQEIPATTITTSGDITCDGNSVNTAINTVNNLMKQYIGYMKYKI